jgi:hypothetical protein
VGYEKKHLGLRRCNSLVSIWKVTAKKKELKYYTGFNVRNFIKFGVLFYESVPEKVVTTRTEDGNK